MRIGLNTFLYTSPFTTAKAPGLFSKYAGWGFETVEVAVEDPRHVDPTKLRQIADRAGIAIGTVCAAMGPGRDFRGTAREQKIAMDYLRALIDQAAIIGAPKVIGPVYSVTGRADAVEPAQQKKEWKLVVKNLQTLARHAETKGVTVCIEPLNRFETDFLNTCDQGLALLDDVGSDAMKLLLDTFHMNIEEKDQPAAIRKVGSQIGHFHACGSDRGTPGNDHIDWPGIAKALKSVGYKGDIVIESFTTDVKVIARAAAIWRKIEPRRDDIAIGGLTFLRKLFK